MRLLPRLLAATEVSRPEADLTVFLEQLPEVVKNLPKLYELLICNWAWKAAKPLSHEICLSVPGWNYPLRYSLLGNPYSKRGFVSLLRQMRRDRALWEATSASGFLPFAQGGGQAYDLVCFDLNRLQEGDCPVVVIDHEQILCFDTVKISLELAPTFRKFIEGSIQYVSKG